MKQYLSTLLFLILALPFIYMILDVIRDVYRRTRVFYKRRVRTLLQGVLQTFFQ